MGIHFGGWEKGHTLLGCPSCGKKGIIEHHPRPGFPYVGYCRYCCEWFKTLKAEVKEGG